MIVHPNKNTFHRENLCGIFLFFVLNVVNNFFRDVCYHQSMSRGFALAFAVAPAAKSLLLSLKFACCCCGGALFTVTSVTSDPVR